MSRPFSLSLFRRISVRQNRILAGEEIFEKAAAARNDRIREINVYANNFPNKVIDYGEPKKLLFLLFFFFKREVSSFLLFLFRIHFTAPSPSRHRARIRDTL